MLEPIPANIAPIDDGSSFILNITSAEGMATQGCNRSADRGAGTCGAAAPPRHANACPKAVNPRGMGTASPFQKSFLPNSRKTLTKGGESSPAPGVSTFSSSGRGACEPWISDFECKVFDQFGVIDHFGA